MKSNRARALKIILVAGFFTACTPQSGVRQAHENLSATLWMQTAVEYDMAVAQAYRLARVMLGRALGDKSWTAALEQTGDASVLPPAVIFDVDETLIDNSPFAAKAILDEDSRFHRRKWAGWVNRKQAAALPGALAFARHAASRNVRVFYVTNRDHKLASATLANLKALGFPVDADGGNLLSKHKRAGWGSDKTTRRAFVARTHRVVLLVGDDLNDFLSGVRGKGVTLTSRQKLAAAHRANWGTRWIMIPNPVYGSWKRATFSFDHKLPDDEIRARKFKALKGY